MYMCVFLWIFDLWLEGRDFEVLKDVIENLKDTTFETMNSICFG